MSNRLRVLNSKLALMKPYRTNIDETRHPYGYLIIAVFFKQLYIPPCITNRILYRFAESTKHGMMPNVAYTIK